MLSEDPPSSIDDITHGDTFGIDKSLLDLVTTEWYGPHRRARRLCGQTLSMVAGDFNGFMLEALDKKPDPKMHYTVFDESWTPSFNLNATSIVELIFEPIPTCIFRPLRNKLCLLLKGGRVLESDFPGATDRCGAEEIAESDLMKDLL